MADNYDAKPRSSGRTEQTADFAVGADKRAGHRARRSHGLRQRPDDFCQRGGYSLLKFLGATAATELALWLGSDRRCEELLQAVVAAEVEGFPVSLAMKGG